MRAVSLLRVLMVVVDLDRTNRNSLKPAATGLWLRGGGRGIA